MTHIRLLAALVIVAALAGCSSGSHSHPAAAPSSTSTTEAPTTTSTTASTTTTTVPTTTTTEAGGPYATFTTAEAAANALVDAWRRGDRGRARQIATPTAIASLFAVPAPGASPQFRGCNTGLGGMSSCDYRLGNPTLLIQLQDVPPTHWQVVQAIVES